MHRFTLILISSFILLLTGCAHTKKPTNIYGNQDGSVSTQGLGEEGAFVDGHYGKNNLIGTRFGPHQGLLENRSYYFAFNSNIVRQTDYPAIKAHARYLMNHPSAKVSLQGNTDIRGSREYNIALGERRSDAVADILRMQGVPQKQISTISFGAEKPIATGHTEKDYQLNRRVDIVYIN